MPGFTSDHPLGGLVDEAILDAEGFLTAFAADSTFMTQVTSAFGDVFDAITVQDFAQQWSSQNFTELPAISILPSSDLNGARGAYSSDTNTIYLSRDIISSAANPSPLIEVLLEEIGHFVDHRVNQVDAAGDEGAIFAAVVRGRSLSPDQLKALRTQDDSAVLTVNGETIHVEKADDYTGTNLKTQMISAIPTFLDSVKTLINNEVLKGLPILGDALGAANPVDEVFNNFRDQLIAKLNAITGDGTIVEVKQALFEVLGSSGLGILRDRTDDVDTAITLDDIDIQLAPDGSNTEFKLAIGKAVQPSISLDSDLGLPFFGLSLTGGVTPQLDFGLNLNFGVDATSGFFLNMAASNKELELNLATQLLDGAGQPLTLNGKLGFLDVTAKDQGSAFNGSFAVDLSGALGSLTADSKLTADANLKLGLTTSLGDASLPSVGADFNLAWDFAPDNLKVDGFYQGQQPTVEFNNVRLNLGTFFKNFAGPVFETINDVLGPIKPVVDVLQTRLPILDDFARGFLDVTGGFPSGSDGRVTLLDLVKLQQPDAPLGFIGAVSEIIELTEAINTLSSTDGIPLTVGGFTLGSGDDIRNSTFSLEGVNFGGLTSTVKPLEDILSEITSLLGDSPEIQQFLGGIEATSGPEFPILTDSNQVFKLLLGQPADFFKYTLPELKFDFDFEAFFPILGPLGAQLNGKVDANLKLALGYDSTGIADFVGSGDAGDIFNGFHIGNGFDPNGPGERESGAELTASLDAYAALNIGIASAGVGGGIGSNITILLNDPTPSDNKVYFDEFDPGCIFNPVTGELTANLNAFIKFGIGPFSYTKRFDIAKATLLSFEAGCSVEEQSDPVKHNLAVSLGANLQLSMGTVAPTRRINFVAGTDVAEVFRIDYKSGAADNATLTVSAFGAKLDYANVSQIFAEGGALNDTIVIADAVLTPAILSGGADNDQLYSGSGDDSLQGDSGDDALSGSAGNDTLRGGEGVDLLIGGAGADLLDGGNGPDDANDIDTASYRSSPAGVTILPGDGGFLFGFGGDAQGDRLFEIEHIEGSNFADLLTGDGSNNTLEGLGGNDILKGGDGDDIVLGGAGVDRLEGGSGQDWTSYLTSPGAVTINLATGRGYGGDAAGEVLISVENIQGSTLNDTLIGNESSNYLEGFYGDDHIIGGGGADTLDGKDGIDWVSYRTSLLGVSVSLSLELGFSGDAAGDVLLPNSFENLEGSAADDSLLQGNAGNNVIDGSAGNDVLQGEGGDDTLIGGTGGDSLDGGDGIDVVDYDRSSAGVSVNLQAATGSEGDAQGDTFVQLIPGSLSTVENLRGSRYGDFLVGDDGNNVIDPGLSSSGIDFVFGGAGNDQLKVDYSSNDTGGMFGGYGYGYIIRDNSGGATQALDQYPSGYVFQDRVIFGSDIERFYLRGTIRTDQLFGGLSDDVLLPGGGDDFVSAGQGNDFILGDNGIDTLSADFSTKSDDIVLQSFDITQENAGVNLSVSDETSIQQFEIFQDIKTGKGNDTLTQSDRVNNLFDVGTGSDTVNPGLGFDTVIGGDAESMVDPNSSPGGFPIVTFGPNDDLLILDYSVKDTGGGMVMSGDSQNQTGSAFRSVSEEETLLDAINFSKFERLNITGTSKDDYIFGGDGVDILKGIGGNDTILGNRGNDQLDGGDGDDVLIGTNNISYGGGEFPDYPKDIDSLTGGLGADTFVLGEQGSILYARFANDDFGFITDFDTSQGDVIQLAGPPENYSLLSEAFEGVTFTEIYLGQPPNATYVPRSDLIGIVQSTNSLSLDASYFSFV